MLCETLAGDALLLRPCIEWLDLLQANDSAVVRNRVTIINRDVKLFASFQAMMDFR